MIGVLLWPLPESVLSPVYHFGDEALEPARVLVQLLLETLWHLDNQVFDVKTGSVERFIAAALPLFPEALLLQVIPDQRLLIIIFGAGEVENLLASFGSQVRHPAPLWPGLLIGIGGRIVLGDLGLPLVSVSLLLLERADFLSRRSWRVLFVGRQRHLLIGLSFDPCS